MDRSPIRSKNSKLENASRNLLIFEFRLSLFNKSSHSFFPILLREERYVVRRSNSIKINWKRKEIQVCSFKVCERRGEKTGKRDVLSTFVREEGRKLEREMFFQSLREERGENWEARCSFKVVREEGRKLESEMFFQSL